MRLRGTAWLAVLAVVGCGSVEEDPSTAAGGTAGTAGSAGTAVAGPALAAVPSEMRRLSASEYVATVGDVLGPTPGLLLPTEEVAGFDNIARALGMTPAHYEAFLQAAEEVAGEVFASEAFRARVVTCESEEAECVRSILGQTGLRVFRRPLFDEEMAIYEKV